MPDVIQKRAKPYATRKEKVRGDFATGGLSAIQPKKTGHFTRCQWGKDHEPNWLFGTENAVCSLCGNTVPKAWATPGVSCKQARVDPKVRANPHLLDEANFRFEADGVLEKRKKKLSDLSKEQTRLIRREVAALVRKGKRRDNKISPTTNGVDIGGGVVLVADSKLAVLIPLAQDEERRAIAESNLASPSGVNGVAV